MKKLILLFVVFFVTLQVQAAETDSKEGPGIDAKKIYFGGGLGLNSLSGFDSGIGIQFFAGYPVPLKDLEKGTLAVEAGYMDSGNFGLGTIKRKVNGLWATAVGSYPLKDKLSLIGRIGLDFGDDSGLMFGPGVSMAINKNLEGRVEYIIRDDVNSLQANIVYRQ